MGLDKSDFQISVRVDNTIDKFPEPTTHPRLRLAAKLSLGDVTPEITR